MDKLEEQIAEAKETLADLDHALECEPPPYPWTESLEQDFRCFVFENVVNSDLDVAVSIKQAQCWLEWLTEGKMPPEVGAKNRGLKVVSEKSS